MADSLLFVEHVAATGYALRGNVRQHEKPTTVSFSLVHCNDFPRDLPVVDGTSA
jgi:hypothetical protein